MSLALAAELADNRPDFPAVGRFAAILGANPSKGARSPALWNAAFAAHGLDSRMLPVDISSAKLTALLEALDLDQRFIGGAVAMPHKEAVARWLGGRLTREAAAIGAVNCLYRDNGKLAGTNTDGEGALASYEAKFGAPKGKRVLLLALGGAGRAVAAYFARRAAELTAATRSEAGRPLAARLGAQRWVPWSQMDGALPDADILINCSPLGSAGHPGSPLSRVQLEKLPKQARVFDIIYGPGPSALLSEASRLGLETLDGSAMNLEQAVLGYGRAADEPRGRSATRSAMEAAKMVLDKS